MNETSSASQGAHAILLAVSLAVLAALAVVYILPSISSDESLEDSSDPFTYLNDCSVASITVNGELWDESNLLGENDESVYATDSRDVATLIDIANAHPDVAVIVLEVDSPGGSGVAGEEIAAALERAITPSVAFVRGAAFSAGYIAALGADMIYAHPMSDVGSIGVTSSYVEQSKQNEEEGLTYVSLSSGKFKDILDPNKPLTDEERELIEGDLQVAHDWFVSYVAKKRGFTLEEAQALADGSSRIGAQALEAGLVDEVGTFTDFYAFLKTFLGEDPIICPL